MPRMATQSARTVAASTTHAVVAAVHVASPRRSSASIISRRICTSTVRLMLAFVNISSLATSTMGHLRARTALFYASQRTFVSQRVSAHHRAERSRSIRTSAARDTISRTVFATCPRAFVGCNTADTTGRWRHPSNRHVTLCRSTCLRRRVARRLSSARARRSRARASPLACAPRRARRARPRRRRPRVARAPVARMQRTKWSSSRLRSTR